MQTLVLSQSYEPVKIVNWQRAITMAFLEKAEVVVTYDKEIKAPTQVFKMPAVVRLFNKFKNLNKNIRLSRHNVFARDQYQCGYCGITEVVKKLTIDHIVPRVQGGKTTWNNIVTCCGPCNCRKGGRTPKQAGITLKITPSKPDWLPVIKLNLKKIQIPTEWKYWTAHFTKRKTS